MKPTFLSHFLTPILLFCGVATLPLQAQSYKDPTLSPEERTTDLLRRMTLEEKIAQIRHIPGISLTSKTSTKPSCKNS